MSIQTFDNYIVLPADESAPSTTVNDLQITASVVVLAPTVDIELTGMLPPVDVEGGFCALINAGPGILTCMNDDSRSSAGYRVLLPGGMSSLPMAPDTTQGLFYVSGLGWRPAISPLPVPSDDEPEPLGSADPGVSLQYSRADHVHAIQDVPIGSPNTRSLSLATAYQATDTAKAALVTVTLSSTANFSLSGGTTNTATIVIGSTNAVASGTGSVVGKYTNSVTGTIAVGLNMNSQMVNTYTVALPAGWYFAVRQTAGTITIDSAFDQAVG